MSFWPMPSRTLQRFSEAMQSSAVTGWPSCHSRPSRSVKVQVSLSSLTLHLSTICGLTCELLVEGEQRVVDHHAVVRADQRRGPHRIDDLEVGVQRHLQRRLGAKAAGAKARLAPPGPTRPRTRGARDARRDTHCGPPLDIAWAVPGGLNPKARASSNGEAPRGSDPSRDAPHHFADAQARGLTPSHSRVCSCLRSPAPRSETAQ